MDGVLGGVSIVINHHNPKWLGEAYFSWQEHITANHRRKLGQAFRAWKRKAPKQRNAAYWLAPLGLLSLISYSTQDHQPRGIQALPSVSRALQQQSSTKKKLHRLCPRTSLVVGDIFSFEVSSSKMILCPADTKQAGTVGPLSAWHTSTSLLDWNFPFFICP